MMSLLWVFGILIGSWTIFAGITYFLIWFFIIRKEDQIKCQTVKYWSELTQKEKIERTRQRVKGLESTIRRLEDTVWELRRHQHNDKGEAIIEKRIGDNMIKKEKQKLNTIHKVNMAAIKELAKSREYRLGYKAGFNTARRRIRKVLGVLITHKNP